MQIKSPYMLIAFGMALLLVNVNCAPVNATVIGASAEDMVKYSIYILVAGVFLMSYLLIKINRSLNRSQERVAELNGLNDQVSEQNRQLVKALSALEQSYDDNDKLMKIAAHDLRNPIGAIYSAAALLLNVPDRTDNDLEMLELIRSSSQNSLDLAEALLLRTDLYHMKKAPLDLLEHARYCVNLLRHKADVKKQEIYLEGLPLSVPADGEKLWRVFSNLILNAIKFSPESSAIEVSLSQNDQWALIAVKDKGIGVPEHMQNKIFDMFTDAKRMGTNGEQSHGMGLAISRQIIEAHGGKLWFEPVTAGGSVFFAKLPLNDSNA